MAEDPSFIGRGWSFPPRFDGKFNQLETVTLAEEVRESIFIILSTIPGERVTNPEFGCKIYDLIWKPIDKATKILMDEVIRQAIYKYEPRIILEDIIIESD
ncbi:MAG: GPW/gp25 family protein, partial [Bacteroidota bacterium]